jgi:hypothetical protein
MKSEYSSFISEHTAEYILVPRLTQILKKKFEMVVPIYPWMTREGNNLSKSIHSQDKFKIVGFYPRRPKISIEEDKICIKINPEFIEGAIEAVKIKIPIIAGCPLVKSFWDLNENTSCYWIKLDNETKDLYEFEFSSEVSPEYRAKEEIGVFKSEEQLLTYVTSICGYHDIHSLIHSIHIIRQHSSTVYFMGFGSYKPIYFLLRDK